jgi:uncharacterized iron-regulated membrane protein
MIEPQAPDPPPSAPDPASEPGLDSALNGARPSPKPRAPTLRRALLVVHRYVGLFLSAFLLVAGLTGTLLAFREPLDAALNPELFRPEAKTSAPQVLEPFELAARAARQFPTKGGDPSYTVNFNLKPGHAVSTWVEAEPEKWREYFIDPASGKVLGSRSWGDLTEGKRNVLPFLYQLHYSLALGEVGTILFGVAALLWVFDCFVGAALTLPAPARRAASPKGVWFWLKRWLPAWLLKAQRLFALVFTWHRASGLWIWGMLLIFAWSAVGLNLNDVYRPVMAHTFGLEESFHDQLPELPPPHPAPGLAPHEAHLRAQRIMKQELKKLGAHVKRELDFSYAAEHRVFIYSVESSLDISSKYPNTVLYLDRERADFLGLDVASGRSLGTTITSWLYALHFGAVGGLAYQVFVSILGFLVALLSVTGVWIWVRKRRLPKNRRAPHLASAELESRPKKVPDALTI